MRPPASVRIGALEMSAAEPAVVVALTGPDDSALDRQADAALAVGADLIEWRADLWDRHGEVAFDVLAHRAAALRDRIRPVPLLLTMRTRAEGGEADDEVDLAALVAAALDADACDAVDVEIARPTAAAAMAVARQAELPVIASFHAVDGPLDEPQIISRLEHMEQAGAQVAKIALAARTAADEAALLHATAVRALTARIPLLTIAMGEQGVASRLLGHRYGSCATFALATQDAAPSAPGQVPLERVRSARALLGGPEGG